MIEGFDHYQYEGDNPMDRDDYIIRVYCLVCEHYQAVINGRRLRQRGFSPALSDEINAWRADLTASDSATLFGRNHALSMLPPST